MPSASWELVTLLLVHLFFLTAWPVWDAHHDYLFFATCLILTNKILFPPHLTSLLFLKNLYPAIAALWSYNLPDHVVIIIRWLCKDLNSSCFFFQHWVCLCTGIWDGVWVVQPSQWKWISLPRYSVPCICSPFSSHQLSVSFELHLPVFLVSSSSHKVTESIALALSDGSPLSPAVLISLWWISSHPSSPHVSESGSHGYRSLNPDCNTSHKGKSWCIVHATFCPNLWAAGLRPSSLGHPCPYFSLSVHPRNALEDWRSHCQHHWFPCGWAARGYTPMTKQPLQLLFQCHRTRLQKTRKMTQREILMPDLRQSHRAAFWSSQYLRKSSKFFYWSVLLNY